MKPTSEEIRRVMATFGAKGGAAKTPRKAKASKANIEKAHAARRKQRSGPNCLRCKKPWKEHDADPCR
jgi:hypothetical protein